MTTSQLQNNLEASPYSRMIIVLFVLVLFALEYFPPSNTLGGSISVLFLGHIGK